MSEQNTPVEPPTNHAIEFTIQGKWAHFRRIDTTTTKQSYRVIPPTTAMGLIAGMLGYSRDSYYETFAKSNAAFSIIVEESVDPFQLSKLDLNTSSGDFESGRGKGVLKNLISRESTLGDRQQRLYEYLRNPVYRIVAAIDDEDIRSDFSDRLSNREFVYTPALGRSECLAGISGWKEYKLLPVETNAVDSTAPIDVAQATNTVSVERTPQRLTTETHSRKPTSFVSYAYSQSGDETPTVDATKAYSTGTDRLLFV
jgi:CRISPR-associated protein Cas5h